jgi:DMSO/TMAO reductase YedYZ molybdopterin-dependent catalytic subunit
MGILRNRGLSDDERARIPPGQHMVRDFPVLHVGSVPYTAAPDDWDLRVWGEVDTPLRWTLDEVRALPVQMVTCDIHCVTTWSKLDTLWEGIPFSEVLDRVQPTAAAAHVLAHCEAGYTTNIPLADLQQPDVMLAYGFGGHELEPEHGRPLRLLVPHLYLWKSAKWLRGLEFLDHDQQGYWERLGYSNTADPWKEERYSF